MTSITTTRYPAVLQGAEGPFQAMLRVGPSDMTLLAPTGKPNDYDQLGTLDYSLDNYLDSDEGYVPALKVDYIVNTSHLSDNLIYRGAKNIGTVLMEAFIAKAVRWTVKVGEYTYPSNDLITLFADKKAIFFYWRLGLRPRSDCNFIIHPDFQDIWKKLDANQQLKPKEQVLYDQRKTLVAKEKNVPESALAPEDVCEINLTAEIEKLYQEAERGDPHVSLGKRLKAISQRIPCVSGVNMDLPREAQTAWKRRILFRPSIDHEKELMNQMFFEAVVLDISPKVAKIVGDYLDLTPKK